jgi:hypothetical protein
MMTLISILADAKGNGAQQQHPRYGWIPARPLAGPFLWRLRDAWAVLRDRAVAVRWPA